MIFSGDKHSQMNTLTGLGISDERAEKYQKNSNQPQLGPSAPLYKAITGELSSRSQKYISSPSPTSLASALADSSPKTSVTGFTEHYFERNSVQDLLQSAGPPGPSLNHVKDLVRPVMSVQQWVHAAHTDREMEQACPHPHHKEYCSGPNQEELHHPDLFVYPPDTEIMGSPPMTPVYMIDDPAAAEFEDFLANRSPDDYLRRLPSPNSINEFGILGGLPILPSQLRKMSGNYSMYEYQGSVPDSPTYNLGTHSEAVSTFAGRWLESVERHKAGGKKRPGLQNNDDSEGIDGSNKVRKKVKVSKKMKTPKRKPTNGEEELDELLRRTCASCGMVFSNWHGKKLVY
jgi:hypothetical protein